MLDGARVLRYLMCCDISKYSKIILLGGLSLSSRVQEVASIIFAFWDNKQNKKDFRDSKICTFDALGSTRL